MPDPRNDPQYVSGDAVARVTDNEAAKILAALVFKLARDGGEVVVDVNDIAAVDGHCLVTKFDNARGVVMRVVTMDEARRMVDASGHGVRRMGGVRGH